VLPNDLLEKSIAEELHRLLAYDLHARRPRRVEGEALNDVRGIEVTGVERRVDRGRLPDEAASDPLA
jgi:hypothetical protein